jgi:serine/threonine protein kinase
LQPSVFAAFRELLPAFAPAGEVSVDHLTLGTGSREQPALDVHGTLVCVMCALGAKLLAERGLELVATPGDEAIRVGERRGSRGCSQERVAGCEGRVQRRPCLCGACLRCVEARASFSGIADRGREIAAFSTLVAFSRVADSGELVAIPGHNAMLHCPRMRPADEPAPMDRYVVLEHLSEGGMGAIYVGKKMGAGGFEMEVVLKQLLPEFTQQEEFIDLFLREAKLSATLDHANIVHTIDLVTAGGEYFIVMEYLPGGDLRTLLKKAKRRGKRFSPAAAIYISREVLSALAYAHSKRDFDGNPLKLIHRDVSPSNILLSYSGEVKLTDFGIAKAATHTSLFYKVKGKVGYMSPEQAKSESIDHRSDLYSIAVCMYEILTGERLFVHAGLTTSADEIYSQQVPNVSRKVPGLTPDLDAVMQKALSLDPAKRYQTAGEFQEALMRCAHRNGLLMGAPELAEELRAACGPNETWRGEDEEEDPNEAPRAGTEVYDALDDSDDDDDAGDDDDNDDQPMPMSIHALAARAKSPASPRLPGLPAMRDPARPKTEVDRFAGVELTSIINMMGLDDQGSEPLVDLNVAPTLDSGPRAMDLDRRLDSDPALNAFVSSLPPTMTSSPPPPPSRTGERPFTPAPLDVGDMLPTAPRRVSTAGVGTTPRQQFQTPRPGSRFTIKAWMVIVALVAVGLVVTLIVALSGPDLPRK